jgi:hypothetical protein
MLLAEDATVTHALTMGKLDDNNDSAGDGGLIRSATIEANPTTGDLGVITQGEGGFWLGYNSNSNVLDYQFFIGDEAKSVL